MVEAGPTRTLLAVEDEDELAKSDVPAVFKLDASFGPLSSKSLSAPHSARTIQNIR